MWKESFPPILERYLFAQIRPASSASEESCSYSLETKCTHKGNSSTPAFLRPKSKIRICYVSTSLLRGLQRACYLGVGDTSIVTGFGIRLVLAYFS